MSNFRHPRRIVGQDAYAQYRKGNPPVDPHARIAAAYQRMLDGAGDMELAATLGIKPERAAYVLAIRTRERVQ